MSDTQQIIEKILTDKKHSLGVDTLPQSELLQTLILIQKTLGYMPNNGISLIAEAFNISRADVHGVITFYDDLDLRDEAPARSKHVLQICQAEACQSMGVREIMRKLKKHDLASNGDITIQKVYCLGNCALAPAVMLDGEPYGNMTYDKINELF